MYPQEGTGGFPLIEYTALKKPLSSTIVMHPIVDTMDLVANILHIDLDILYPLVDILNLVANTLHVPVDTFYLPLDILHSITDAMCDLQQLRRCHPCLFLCQLVQPLHAILDLCVSYQLLEKHFCITRQSRIVNLHNIHSLSRPRFTSFVAIARMVSTSTIISTIMFVIAGVGVMPV